MNFTVPLTREFRHSLLKGISLLLLLHFASAALFAGEKTGADFLKIPIGAEAAGLGQAYTALSNGINALNSNPAGLAQQPQFLSAPSLGLSVSHQEQFLDTSLDHMGLSLPLGQHQTHLGLNIVRMAYGTQDQRTSDRQKTGSFGASDMLLGLAAAKNFNGLQLGTQIKWIRMDLAGYQSQGAALDVGALASTIGGSRFSLGLSARNIGPKMKFISDEFDLPLSLSLGTAFQVIGPLSLSLEIQNRPYQNQTSLAVGTQMLASSNVTLRAGYLAKVAESVENNQKSETNRGTFANINGLAAGLGVRINQVVLDYAITPFGELGNTHSLTFSTWFGGSLPLADLISPSSNNTEPTVKPTQNDRAILILFIEDDPLNRQLMR